MCNFPLLKGISSGIGIFNTITRWLKDFLFIQKIRYRKYRKKYPYYFTEYNKHITVYDNGNGIIINSCKVIFSDKAEYIYRKLNIEDGKKDNAFPELAAMLKTKKKDRFNEFGFWYYAEDNIIEDVEEYYWSDTNQQKIDKKIQENDKELRWRFKINGSKIQQNKEYKLVYVISIKGLYPIRDGCIDENQINDPNSDEKNSSSLAIVQGMKKCSYIVSFDDSIKLENEPECKVCKQVINGQERPVSLDMDYNTLYKKHIFRVDNPDLGSIIEVTWKFKK